MQIPGLPHIQGIRIYICSQGTCINPPPPVKTTVREVLVREAGPRDQNLLTLTTGLSTTPLFLKAASVMVAFYILFPEMSSCVLF